MLYCRYPPRPYQFSHDVGDAAREYEHSLQLIAPTWNVSRGVGICRFWIYSHFPPSQATQLPEPLVSCLPRDIHGHSSMAGELSRESTLDALNHGPESGPGE